MMYKFTILALALLVSSANAAIIDGGARRLSPGKGKETKAPGKGGATKAPGKGGATKAPGKETKAPGKETKAPGKGGTQAPVEELGPRIGGPQKSSKKGKAVKGSKKGKSGKSVAL